MRRASTTPYTTKNATLIEEVEHRKYMLAALKADKNADGTKPYALAYGFRDSAGRKKLLKKCPVFPTEAAFERYIKKHKQTVLAVYNR